MIHRIRTHNHSHRHHPNPNHNHNHNHNIQHKIHVHHNHNIQHNIQPNTRRKMQILESQIQEEDIRINEMMTRILMHQHLDQDVLLDFQTINLRTIHPGLKINPNPTVRINHSHQIIGI